jgi:hypothetical protein
MNMIERFPDASVNIRAERLLLSQKKNAAKFSREMLGPDSNKELARFYDDEFKKWHLQLAFIVTGCVVLVYVVAFNASDFFNWIMP